MMTNRSKGPAQYRLHDVIETIVSHRKAGSDPQSGSDRCSRQVPLDAATRAFRNVRFALRALRPEEAVPDCGATPLLRKPRSTILKQADGIVSKYPAAQVDRTLARTTVKSASPSGFDVSLLTDSGRCTLALGSWYDDFDCIGTAMSYFDLALNGGVRVRIDKVGMEPVQWAIERHLGDEVWVEEGLMGVLWHRCDRPRQSVYLRNALRCANTK